MAETGLPYAASSATFTPSTDSEAPPKRSEGARRPEALTQRDVDLVPSRSTAEIQSLQYLQSNDLSAGTTGEESGGWKATIEHAPLVERRRQQAAALAGDGAYWLGRVAAEDGLQLAESQDELSIQAWVAIARLIRAGLADENGRILYATEAGEAWLARFEARLDASQ
jgi:hypothetical protein